MKILLYILLAIFLLIGAFFLWFFLAFAKVPDLKVPPNATEEQRLELVDNYLAALNKTGKFNGAVLLARNHQPLLLKTYGYTDYHLTEPLTNQSSFRLASVSKQFTAAAVLRAQELALLNVEALVTDYLPNFPYPEVTVQHLLNHTSGVPDNYMELAELHLDEIGEILTVAEVVRLVNEAKAAPDQTAGNSFSYSNTNYVLLAGIIEQVSGKSFEDFLAVELFGPLGMPNTRVWNLASVDSTFVNKTQSFSLFAGIAQPLKPDFLDGVAGDGAVFSSIEDFLLWDRFWAESDLITDSLKQLAFQPATLLDGTTSNYGFGWSLEKDYHWHNGAWLGAMTHIARKPNRQTMLVLLDNSQNIRFGDIAREIEKIWHTL